MKKGDIVRCKGVNSWNADNYLVTGVFQNEDDPTDRLLCISWVEPHTHTPRSAMANEYQFILAPSAAETASTDKQQQ